MAAAIDVSVLAGVGIGVKTATTIGASALEVRATVVGRWASEELNARYVFGAAGTTNLERLGRSAAMGVLTTSVSIDASMVGNSPPPVGNRLPQRLPPGLEYDYGHWPGALRMFRAMMSTLYDRIAWGVKWGLMFGLSYSCIGMVIFLVGGSAPFTMHHTTLFGAISIYLEAGLAAGLIVAAMLPLTRWRAGAGFTGFVALLPWGYLMGAAIAGARRTPVDLVSVVLFAVVIGIPVGLIYREIFLEQP